MWMCEWIVRYRIKEKLMKDCDHTVMAEHIIWLYTRGIEEER